MTFGDEIIGKLFPSAASPNEPLFSELLERSKNDKANYKKWLSSKKHLDLNQTFYLSYFLKKKNISSSTNVYIFNSRFANAFSISCPIHMNPKSFQYYFDYLKDKVLELGYSLKRSDREIIDRTHYIETIDRHYLNFPNNYMIGKRKHQLYGNILIEHISIDDKPSYIKLMVTYQTGSSFTKPLGFDELTKMIFDF